MRAAGVLVGLLAGMVILGEAIRTTLRDARNSTWPSTAGTLNWAAPLCSRHAYKGEIHTTCESRVYYRYRVDREYTGTRVTFNDDLLFGFGTGWAAKYRGNTSGNTQVTVWYDPADPAAAVLEPRTLNRWLLWVVGAGLTLGLGQALLTRRDDAAPGESG